MKGFMIKADEIVEWGNISVIMIMLEQGLYSYMFLTKQEGNQL